MLTEASYLSIVTVALETLTCVEFSPELHRSLILEKTQRKLLMATVQSFRNAATGSSESRRQTRDSDPIPSPGSSEDEDEVLNHDQDDWHDDDNASDSLVLLLHGAPGTGKTMTARFVANYTHRPLLSLSLAKMGADFSDLELKIKEISKLARQWGCIVLLKHADVYLAARSSANTLENNMVTFGTGPSPLILHHLITMQDAYLRNSLQCYYRLLKITKVSFNSKALWYSCLSIYIPLHSWRLNKPSTRYPYTHHQSSRHH